MLQYKTRLEEKAEAVPAPGRTRAGKIPHLRWGIALMLFLAAILNYIDRQTLSILAPTIQGDLGLSEADYGNIASLFLVAYTAALLLSGRLVDALGPRLSLAIFITWWSAANMLTAAVRSFASLGVCRFLLGLGEAGNWPASLKAVSEWFPARERGIAIGFYTMGATVGATIAPVLITGLAGRWGWQMAFFATGVMGLLWVLPWLWLYRRPGEHPRITQRELALLAAEADTAPETASPAEREDEWRRWANVLRRRDVWLLMLGRMLTDPVWYFYQFWFAKYLFSMRHVPQDGLGITWVVFLAADLGSLGGGFMSAFLIKRGARPAASRLWAMLLCACLAPLSLLAPTAPTLGGTLALAMVVVLAHLAWLGNISALLVDVVPRRFLATAFGVVATGSALGGIIMNKVVVHLIEHYSYNDWFTIAAFLHPLAWLILWAGRLAKPAPHDASVQRA